ncbi:MAG: adenylosuccinate synthase [Candidatus Thorarchaeota archaeon]
MNSLVVVGLQWGDEGKGKIVDFLAEDFDIVVRFQGGSNAGHTVIIGDEVHKFRIMPTGAVRGKSVVIGNGVVVDPKVLWTELEQLKAAGLKVNLLISDRAHLITPYHIQIDELQEISKGEQKVGTTKRGIGPTYSDKVSRIGVRLSDFLHGAKQQWNLLQTSSQRRIETQYESEVKMTAFDEFRMMVDKLLPYVGDCGEYLDSELNNGKRILFEGAQGTMLDIDHGTYPFVTSSNCVSSAASSGTGIPFSKIGKVLGISKAYLTRVGTGPFPTELDDAVGQQMRDQGNEYGTVTGRPRRCGWLDLVALRYAVRINGCELLALTKVDVLTGINPLKICVAYEINGAEVTTLPANAYHYSLAKPVYKEFEGWPSVSSTTYSEFPDTLKKYVEFIEHNTGTKIAVISIGPKRSQTIVIDDLFL